MSEFIKSQPEDSQEKYSQEQLKELETHMRLSLKESRTILPFKKAKAVRSLAEIASFVTPQTEPAFLRLTDMAKTERSDVKIKAIRAVSDLGTSIIGIKVNNPDTKTEIPQDEFERAQKSAEILLTMFDSENLKIRQAALINIGEFGAVGILSSEIKSKLEEIYANPDTSSQMKDKVAIELGFMAQEGNKEMIKKLADIIDPKRHSETFWHDRFKACSQLRRIADQEFQQDHQEELTENFINYDWRESED